MALYVENDYVVEGYTQDSVSIDWGASVIFVPKTFLTLVQTEPHEIYDLDINIFRLKLKDLEDNANGISYLKTNNHNTEISLGGLTYARVVEVLSPYTITFENGDYSVNLVGANSNVGDRLNLNGVGVRSNNSAGLISSTAIEYSSFQGGVIIDVNSGISGTVFPKGTEQAPVDNIPDALLIADFRGFKTIFVNSDLDINGNYDLKDFVLQGKSHVNTQITIAANSDVDNMTIIDCEVTGVMDGNTTIKDSVIGDLNFFNGHIHDSSLYGTITLAGSLDAYMNNISSNNVNQTPIIDMGGSGQSIAIPNFSGILLFKNMSGTTDTVGIGLEAGGIILDSTTVTAGTIIVSGIGFLTDENNERILSGMWNGSVNIINNLINRDTVSEASQLSVGVYLDENGVSGTTFPIGSKRTPVNNIADAVIIAEGLGVEDLYFSSDFTIDSSVNITDYSLIGEGRLETILTFENGCIVAGCSVKNATATGLETGIIEFIDCLIVDLGSVGLVPSSISVIITRSLFDGTITLPSNYSGTVTIIDSYSNVPGNNTPVLDLGDSTADLQFRNFTGGLELTNASSGNTISIDLVSGNLKLADSVTNANVTARGVGKMVESSTGDYIPTGVWNGNVNVNNDIMSKGTIADAVLDTSLIGYETDNTVADSLRTNNYADFIHLDVLHGVSGTTYPIGTIKTRVNNINDAYIISQETGIENILVYHDYVFSGDTFVAGLKIYGQGKQQSTFTFVSGSSVGGSQIFNAKITGNGFGVTGFENSHIIDYNSSGLIASSVDVVLQDCLVEGKISLPSNYSGTIAVLDCWMLPSNGVPPIIDMGGGNMSIQLRNISGFFSLENCTNVVDFRAFFVSGGVKLDSSVTAGNFTFTGVGTLFNESTSTTSLDVDALISKEIIGVAVWDEPLKDHTVAGTTGRILSLTAFNGKVWLDADNGIAGTEFPIGTQAHPSNVGADALAIANREGIDEFRLNGDFTSTQSLTGYTIGGDTWLDDSFIFDNNEYDEITFRDLHLSGIIGTFGDKIQHKNCYIENIDNFSGEMIGCRISNSIKVGAGKTLSGVELVIEGDFTVIDLGGVSGTTVSLDVNSGYIKFINAVDGCFIDLNFKGGEILLDASCTGGDFYAEGIAAFTNDSAMNITDNHLLSLDSIADATWNKTLP